MDIKKYFLQPIVFKIFFTLLIINSTLALYNLDAYYRETGDFGLTIFIISACVVALYLLGVIFSKIDNTRLQVQISSYFLLSGLIQFIIMFRRYYDGGFIDYIEKSNIWMLYVGLFLLGIFLVVRYKTWKPLLSKKTYRKDIDLTSLIFVVVIQAYLANPIYFNGLFVKYQPTKAIINIIKSGKEGDRIL